MFNQYLKKSLTELKDANLLREMRYTNGPQSEECVINGQKVLNFCSNNYLGLANDPRLIAAAEQSLKEDGLGAGASRLICGNMRAHDELEKKLAAFKGCERTLLFSTGYMANVGIISGLFNEKDLIISDRLNHASIIDGIILSRARFKRYAHRDMDALEQILKDTNAYKKRVIITDSVFSMDGDVAPLDKIVELKRKYNCFLMIDEAHAFGVVGKQGRGLAEHYGVEEEIDVQMGTFSKAAGSFGAYCCGSLQLIEYLVNKARSFVYTTGMPGPIAAASKKAIEIIEQEPERRKRLLESSQFLINELKGLGYQTLYTQTPIIPVVLEDGQLALNFSEKLLKQGIFVSAIRPPTVPQNTARLRLSVMATHSQNQLEKCLGAFKEVGKELGVI